MELVATHKLTTYTDIHTTLVYCTCFVNTLIQSLSPRMHFLSSFYMPYMRGRTISAYPLLYVYIDYHLQHYGSSLDTNVDEMG